jgi:hypothetical protein
MAEGSNSRYSVSVLDTFIFLFYTNNLCTDFKRIRRCRL